MATAPFRNIILQHLDSQAIDRLQLRRVSLPVRFELEVAGHPVKHLYFLEEGIASMTTCFENGMQVETGMFGFEAVIGASAFMGVKHSLNAIFMQLAGHGYTAPLAAAHAELRRNSIFQRLILRYVQTQLTMSAQNAACNATHNYEQRLARWLLICSDRANHDTLEMAQEFVSEMIGSTRSTVSIAAAHLKAKGLIDYHRGVIQILDRHKLEAEACECYHAVKAHLEDLASFDPGFTA